MDELVGKLADRLPLMTRYAKQQLDFWRDLAWHGTIGHARDWLALSMLSEEPAEGVRSFVDRKGSAMNVEEREGDARRPV